MSDPDLLVEPVNEGAEPGPPVAWSKRIVGEVRDHPFGYGVLAAFLVIGPVAASLLFPEAPPGVSIVGGLALGGYAALCAVPQKFL